MLFEIFNCTKNGRCANATLSLLGILAFVILNGCSADYDTFGVSDYRNLEEISFAEQDGSSAVYSAERRMEFDFVAPSESQKIWDSLTIENIDMSHFASLHLVDDEIEEFPTDSLELDSLAQKVPCSKNAVKVGDKIQVPSSHIVYVVVVSESGMKSIWQLVLNIPEPESERSSSSVKSAKSSSSVKSSASSSASSSSAKSAASSSASSSSTKNSSSSNSGESRESSDSRDSSSSAAENSIESSGSRESKSSDSREAPAPRILSLSIAGKSAEFDADRKTFHLDDFDFRTDLTALELSEMELSEGATANIEVGESYDFGAGVQVTVTNANDESETYSVKAGYQLPGSNFNTWKGDNVTPDSIWGNANTILTTTEKITSGSMIGAQIQTSSALTKMASGSLYTADFNPKGVGTLSMASSSTWPDGNELLDFGKPFAARPEFMEVKFSYEGKGDSCDIYILLENRTGDKNVNRKSSDVNKLVASAWFRSTKADNSGRENPDVVSVSEPDENKMRTLRLKLQYGEPLAGSPIENSSTFNTKLESSNKSAINNGLVQGTGDELVTHIRVVFASSADGNHYKGTKGAILVIDEMKLIY
ncbi:PCMD domain-containing protein [Fibrobacter succinogenes]|uniref:Carbohydrate metabolism domain-containing protein n=1 Tax=Fibrobacter succinogenes TaxID=833 RepID=A0A380RVE9_FIBSU|nr:PCMD domain-containing protein [Fibrobacter succinogenes]PWJ37239.1 putative glycosyl hydrolase or carbohydrate binding protein [Fibrobacter succinogenes subsp. elongatus]SUQ19486.1 Putative carbohydrate metabolism domain-containing protein [Fibrobacter succinogenes]